MKKYFTILLTIFILLCLNFVKAEEKNTNSNNQQINTPADIVFVSLSSHNQYNQQKFDINLFDNIETVIPWEKPESLDKPEPSDLETKPKPYWNSIMVFDTKTPEKTTYINFYYRPYWLVYNKAVKFLYISTQADLMVVYDPDKSKVIGGFDVKGQITDMCLNNNGSMLYMAVKSKPNVILVIDCYKNRFIKKYVASQKPSAIAVSKNADTFYFTTGSDSSGIVYAINNSIGSKAGEIKVGNNPNGLCMRPDGGELYVSNLNDASVCVIDPATFTVKSTIPTGINPFKMVASKDSKKIYVTCIKSNRVDVIDTNTHTVIKTINTGNAPTGIAINGGGSRIYVTNNESRTISVIDTKNDTVVQTATTILALPSWQPWGIAVK